ncbi:HutD family protein [Paeniglutamicibacter sp.]|uniref:HutD/Ves family protein n=1 Tax=Paeniglutamicibacter sp. TaxID=1934391 RepID=UPI003989F689
MGTAQNRDLSPGTVIAYSGLRHAPWRNGGGVTRQIASGRLNRSGIPEATSGDDWDWRLSIADVDSPGNFSAFVGMSRILTVIEGEGLMMSIDGIERRLEKYSPLGFDGGSATSATLPDGPIRDLNLIARTGTVTGHVAIVELSPEHPLQLTGGRLGVLLQGQAKVLVGGKQAGALERYDTIVGGGESTPSISGRGFVAVVSLEPAEP